MANLSIDVVYSGTYFAGLISSAVVLAKLQDWEHSAARNQANAHFDPIRRVWRTKDVVRIMIDDTPLLQLCPGHPICLLSPSYILGSLLIREPMSVAPFVVSWFSVLCSEYRIAGIAVAIGYAWRVFWDKCIVRSRTGANAALLRKLFLCAGVGMFIASIIYVVVVLLIGALVFLAFAGAAGVGDKRKRNRY